MKCKVLQERNYMGIGLKIVDDIIDLEDNTAKQFISQGFMCEVVEKKTMTEKTKSVSQDVKTTEV